MKRIVLMIMFAMILVSMAGCGKQNDNLTKEEFDNSLENEKSDSQDNINTQDSKKEETFEEKEITLNQKDKEILEDLLCEVTDFYKMPQTGERVDNTSIIPNNDEDKIKLLYTMFCDTWMNPTLNYDKYKSSDNAGKLVIPISDINKILNDAFNSSIDNPTSSKSLNSIKYSNGNYEFLMGNRGEDAISCSIDKTIQISEKQVKFIGVCKSEGPGGINYNEEFNAIADINKSSMFAGYTLVNISYDKNTSNNGDYILQDSDKKYLTDNDIKDLSKDQLALARNEIYARHGYVFKESKFKSYFESKSWYKQNTAFTGDDSQLSDCEKANINLIKTWEDKK